jgi:PhnB protein
MHISLPISKETALMGCDASEFSGPAIFGNNFSLSISPDSEEAYRLFNGLAEGGTIVMPMQPTFWNAIFGILTDKFGVQWTVNYDIPANN